MKQESTVVENLDSVSDTLPIIFGKEEPEEDEVEDVQDSRT